MSIASFFILLILLKLLELQLAVSCHPVDNFIDRLGHFQALRAQFLEGVSDLLHLFDAAYPANGQVVD